MIERHGDRAGDVLERFVAANRSQEDIEAKALWADVRVAVRVLTSGGGATAQCLVQQVASERVLSQRRILIPP